MLKKSAMAMLGGLLLASGAYATGDHSYTAQVRAGGGTRTECWVSNVSGSDTTTSLEIINDQADSLASTNGYIDLPAYESRSITAFGAGMRRCKIAVGRGVAAVGRILIRDSLSRSIDGSEAISVNGI